MENSSQFEFVHPLDLLKLTEYKIQALYQEEDHCLRQELLNAKVAQTIRSICRSKPRIVVKRSRDSDEDNEEEAPRKFTVTKDIEPSSKRIKKNFIGPFSSEDFMTHMFPDKCEDKTINKDPIILYKDRLATFKDFRFDKFKNAKCTSKTLAQAGFISSGPTSATCPFCSKTREFKSFEDPWKEHEKMGNRCSFMKIAKLNDVTKKDSRTLAQEAIAMANCVMWK